MLTLSFTNTPQGMIVGVHDFLYPPRTLENAPLVPNHQQPLGFGANAVIRLQVN